MYIVTRSNTVAVTPAQAAKHLIRCINQRFQLSSVHKKLQKIKP